MRLFRNRRSARALLATLLLVISGCEREGLTPPPGLLASPQARRDGQAVFLAHCAICHGSRGDGEGVRREAMTPPPANLDLPPWSDPDSARQTFLVIRRGVPRTAMPAWIQLTDQQTWDVVAYLTERGA